MRLGKDKRTYKDRVAYYKAQNKKRRLSIKLFCLEYKGNKCENCGYNKCVDALCFHHLNPENKDFQISHAYRKSKENIIKELDKCQLLCTNCHREVHAELEKLT